MTDTGTGGWHLVLLCAECSATETFKGVVPDLAHDKAVAAGWQYATTPAALATGEEVLGLCPKECACEP